MVEMKVVMSDLLMVETMVSTTAAPMADLIQCHNLEKQVTYVSNKDLKAEKLVVTKVVQRAVKKDDY
jgi:hypothetical protein